MLDVGTANVAELLRSGAGVEVSVDLPEQAVKASTATTSTVRSTPTSVAQTRHSVSALARCVAGETINRGSDELTHGAKMLEVGVGLALGHVAPGPLAEQRLHVVVHGAVGDDTCAQIAAGLADDVQPVLVVVDDMFRAAAQVGERMTVGREGDRHPVDPGYPPQRVEEQRQRVGMERQPADVRRDRWKHVVAGQDHPVFWVVETQVIVGVAGGVHGQPLPAGQAHDLSVDQGLCRFQRLGETGRRRVIGPQLLQELPGRSGALPTPRRWTPQVPFDDLDPLLGRVELQVRRVF